MLFYELGHLEDGCSEGRDIGGRLPADAIENRLALNLIDHLTGVLLR